MTPAAYISDRAGSSLIAWMNNDAASLWRPKTALAPARCRAFMARLGSSNAARPNRSQPARGDASASLAARVATGRASREGFEAARNSLVVRLVLSATVDI